MIEEHPGRWPVTNDGQVLYQYGKLHISGYEINANRLALTRDYILQLEREREELRKQLQGFKCEHEYCYSEVDQAERPAPIGRE